jgi:hypothetical protein
MDYPQRLRHLLDGYRHTTLLYATAKLGLPDLLLSGPQPLSQLAQRLSLNENLLERLLRGLIVLGIVHEESDRRFSVTELGAELRSQAPSSLREAAIIAGEEYLPAWGCLLHTLRTGETAFEHVFGMSPWEHRRQNPELGHAFNTWLRNETASTAEAILQAGDFTGARVVADLGGGQGGLLFAILRAHPHLHGILFDLPHVVDQAGPTLQEAGIGDRCRTQGGDFFAAIPVAADVYLLKSVLHDWEDESCRLILHHCRKAMPPGARLLLIERLLPDHPEDDPAVIMLDLHMLAVLGGRERSAAQYRMLAEETGFRLHQLLPMKTGHHIMEFRPTGS